MTTEPENKPESWRIAALYRFAHVSEPERMRGELQAFCDANGIFGTLLVASEGINGTVAGLGASAHDLVAKIETYPGFDGLEPKWSTARERPFHRTKVRVKREIVTLGRGEVDPRERVGTYVAPADWNAVVNDPDTVVVDTRNGFEVELGSFRGALDPGTESFRDFPAWVEGNREKLAGKRVAMFCTGGIRCEKASSWMLREGFDEVLHLRGGILAYLQQQPVDNSLWEGDCFVFDERVAVRHGLESTDAELCRGCRRPLSLGEREHADFEPGVSCHHCARTLTPERAARLRERHRQVELARRRGELHVGRKA